MVVAVVGKEEVVVANSVIPHILAQNTSSVVDTQPLDYRYACLDQSGIKTSDKYQTNLNSLLSSFISDSSTSNGFGNRSLGSSDDYDRSNSMVYGLYLCRGDVNSSICHSCVQNCSNLIQQHCPNNASAVLWYPFCVLRYSNQYFFGNLTMTPRIPMFDVTQNFTSAGEFDSDARILMNGLIQTGSEAELMFGTHMFNINGTQKRYGWVQCTRDITSEECRTCLSNMLEDVEDCCEGKRVWRIFSPSCVVMYETQPFFVDGTGTIAPTSQPGEESSNRRSMLIAIVVVSAVLVLALLTFCTVYFRCLKRKKEDGLNKVFSEDQEGEDSMNADLPMMPLSTILQTTYTEKRLKLEWKLRLSIINGIAKGLLYLHEDSRLRVIHRDLKASNILLDHEMNPKISDFGWQEFFGEDVKQANNSQRLWGYMAPEYAMEGFIFSEV
ncbi:cysteine-rich receptor-like protein kinase 10 [Senna tora]|uniref:non-specific serine/threonine protein kinase n=1 Tax=Senna tora TaxID=362788 RepID=A0A835CC44_9FABA|nr:cysteine-rich receptor-like protein kinase 10 [Senna tora]